MRYKWIASKKYRGVRYHQHETRKHGVRFDRLFGLRYQLGGKQYQNILGWESEGWTESKAALEFQKLKDAYVLGEGAISLQEKRQVAENKRRAKQEREQAAEKKSITFANFWESTYWQAQQHKSQGSLVAEKGLYTKWIKLAIGHKVLVSLAPSDLEQIKQNMMNAGRQPSSIKYTFAIISQVWNMARKENITQEESPTKKVTLPRKDNRRERFLTPEEASLLLAHLKRQSLQTYQMAVLALYCGLRFGEIAGLDWHSVDFEGEKLSIRDPKSKMNRIAFLPPMAKTMLEEHKDLLLAEKKQALGLVFPSRTGQRMVKVSNTFRNIADKLFNEQVTDARQKVCFHSLRHTFASWLVQRGVDLYSVKELMGHSDFKMTQRYSHLSPEGLRKAAMVVQHAA